MHNSLLKISGLIIFLTFSIIGLSQKSNPTPNLKTDKVWLKNGDVVTGEIKYMKFAKLTIDQDGPGKINIKWEEIVKVRSDKTFEVTMQDGRVLVTKLDSIFLMHNKTAWMILLKSFG